MTVDDAQEASEPGAARTREHVIETESRRILVSQLSADRWVERDLTERDYGIDLTLEYFADGEPSGRLLLLQVKGTDDDPPAKGAASIPFDAKVKHLLRAERFATPILLAWIPVGDNYRRVWFVWIQAYIKAVLDFENPDWRRQKYIRIHIPIDNQLGLERIEGKLVHFRRAGPRRSVRPALSPRPRGPVGDGQASDSRSHL